MSPIVAHVGHTAGILEGMPFAQVDAADDKTGERWSFNAPTMCQAAVKLAEQLGFELEDGRPWPGASVVRP